MPNCRSAGRAWEGADAGDRGREKFREPSPLLCGTYPSLITINQILFLKKPRERNRREGGMNKKGKLGAALCIFYEISLIRA